MERNYDHKKDVGKTIGWLSSLLSAVTRQCQTITSLSAHRKQFQAAWAFCSWAIEHRCGNFVPAFPAPVGKKLEVPTTTSALRVRVAKPQRAVRAIRWEGSCRSFVSTHAILTTHVCRSRVPNHKNSYANLSWRDQKFRPDRWIRIQHSLTSFPLLEANQRRR